MVRVRQQLDDERLASPRETARNETARLLAGAPIRRGQTVAVTGSSRGIANIAEILAGAVAALKDAGLQPFVFPAMGSHGGGTAERQANVLHHYGVTEEGVGAPVRSSTDAVKLAETPEGVPVLFDRIAAGADHVFVVNRIKPHSHFIGPCESGLTKILLIGAGKPEGARLYHRAFARFGFPQTFQAALPVLLQHISVLGGLGIIENGLDQTARVVGLRADRFLADEPALLEDAKRRMGKLPFGDLDVLIVDRMGKDISGVGMDTNVIGRDRPGPRTQVIFVRDLTPASEGNASGIGLADVTVRRLIEKMDPKATFLNCATALHLHLARVPYAFDTDREALEAALRSTIAPTPAEARVVWIRDTLSLGELEVSEALLDEVRANERLSVCGDAHSIDFHPTGSLVDAFPCAGTGGDEQTVSHRQPEQMVAELNAILQGRREFVFREYPNIRGAMREPYGWPEFDPLRHETCLAILFGLYQAAITLTNHFLEKLLRTALTYHDLLKNKASLEKSKTEGRALPALMGALADASKPYEGKSLEDNINRACTLGLITKKQKKQLKVFRDGLRNAYSHADADKTLGGTKLPAHAIRLEDGTFVRDSSGDVEASKFLLATGILQVYHAQQNAWPYFAYIDSLAREVLGKLAPAEAGQC